MQIPLPFPECAAYAEPFIPAACNEAALAWLARPADWPDGRLVLAAAAGLGKTHFCTSAARLGGYQVWSGRAPGDVLRPPNTLIVDDADRCPETSLLHLLNAAREQGARVLLTLRTAPAHAAIGLPDLASRLRAATVAMLGPPDDALLDAILLSACAARQLAVPEPIQRFLRLRLPRTAGAMRHAAAALDRAALATGRTVTRAMAAAIVDAHCCHTDADDSFEPGRYAERASMQEAPP